jgi:hypothetical protein
VICDGFVDEDDAKKPHGKGHVETVKLIRTDHQANKRKRSPPEINAMAGTRKETTSHNSRMKKLTINARMTVKPQNKLDEKLFADTPFVSKKPPPNIDQHIVKLEVYQKCRKGCNSQCIDWVHMALHI